MPPDDDELMLLHEINPGYTVERLPDGALLVNPNGASGGMRNAHLSFQLVSWSARSRCGPTFDSSTGFRLPDTSVLSPDGAFVRADRWEPLDRKQRERYFAGAPDAAFEIVSRTDLREAQLAKCGAYVRNGSALVVLVDPYRRAGPENLLFVQLGELADEEHAPLRCDGGQVGQALADAVRRLVPDRRRGERGAERRAPLAPAARRKAGEREAAQVEPREHRGADERGWPGEHLDRDQLGPRGRDQRRAGIADPRRAGVGHHGDGLGAGARAELVPVE